MYKRTLQILGLFVVIGALCAVPFFSNADTASELQSKIDSQNAAIAAINAEIAEYQKQLTTIGQNKNTLANTIKKLTTEANKLKSEINLTQNKIKANNLQIASLGDSIVQTQASMGDLVDAVSKSIRDENERETNTLGTLLITQKNFAEMWQYASEEASFRKDLREKVQQLVSTKSALMISKTKVETAKTSLVTLASQLQDQKVITQKTVNDKNTLLAQTKNQEAAYQKLVKDKTALKNQMESDMRDYEAKLKYVLDPSSLPKTGSQALAWPVDKVIITQQFGKTSDSGRLYASGTHNGIDFGIPRGTPLKAMASGVVVGTGNTDTACPKASYGMWIYIKYDNGLSSLYGHMSLIKSDMKAGTRVSTGTIVGYSGATGYATGPHLHLTIIAADAGSIQSFPSKACAGRNYTAPVAALNAYLDPMNYLPKK